MQLIIWIAIPFACLYGFMGFVAVAIEGVRTRVRIYANPDKYERLLQEKYPTDRDMVRDVWRKGMLMFLLWPVYLMGWKKDWFEIF